MTKRRASPAKPWSREKAGRGVLTRVAGWADEICERLVAGCHPKQRAAVLDPGDRVSVLCPGRAGKTTSAEVRLLLRLLTRSEAQCVFIATTKEHGVDIAWKKFLKILKRLAVEVKEEIANRVITIVKNGSTLKFAGANDAPAIEKLRGIAWDGIVIDEAASHPVKRLTWLLERALDARTAERDGWIMMIGTPGHYLAGPFYEATRPGGDAHIPFAERTDPKWAELLDEREWSSHHWTLKDAADAGIEAARKSWAAALLRKKRKGWDDKNPVWLREYLGQWAADDTDMVFRYRSHLDDGAPFNQWDPARVGPMQVAVLPESIAAEAMVVITFDKGFKDNFAVNAWAFSSGDPRRRVWHVYAHESPAMSVRGFACLLLGSREDIEEGAPPEPNTVDDALENGTGLIGALGYPVAMAGDVDGAFLIDLGFYGIRAVKADKKMDSKVSTIAEVNGDLLERRWFVLAGSPLEGQLQALQWVPSDEVGGVIKENKAQANHSTDTMIYARRLIAPMQTGVASEAPEDDEDAPTASAPRKPKPAGKPARRARPDREGYRAPLASVTYEGPKW
ncbi:MAG: terminase family protein [Elusimicrobiota bacterium]